KDVMGNIKIGDPMDESTELGPMARKDLRDELHQQVTQSIEKGAKCTLGGTPKGKTGAYYLPTILEGVRPGMPAYDQELFGPVASVIKVKNEEEAIKVANDSKYGLGASIWSKDKERAERMAWKVESGMVMINQRMAADVQLPFGGIKK